MAKFIIALLLFISITAEAQEPVSSLLADSLSNQYFLKGDWDNLIKTGKNAIANSIDYKKLRQRIGFAYFEKGDYMAAEMQYEKALTYDEFDAESRAYLYYCGLNTGNEPYARFYADKLPAELQKNLGIKPFKPVSMIDLEYNYKTNNSHTRSNPTYIRMGIGTQLGYRLTLYQYVADYEQKIDSSSYHQPEYFALLNCSVTSHILLNIAYHHLHTSENGTYDPGNLFLAALSTKINRFTLGANGSVLKDDYGNNDQFGVWGGVTLPGKTGIYFKSSLYRMIDKVNNRFIFSQNAGAHLYKTLWTEGNITFGNLKNYSDLNAFYVYNSVDPTTFRTGLSLFWYVGTKLTIIGNYTYDTKQIEPTNNSYNQQSFSGGIIWKL